MTFLTHIYIECMSYMLCMNTCTHHTKKKLIEISLNENHFLLNNFFYSSNKMEIMIDDKKEKCAILKTYFNI